MKRYAICFLAMAFLFVSATAFAQDFFVEHYTGLSLGGAITGDGEMENPGFKTKIANKVGFTVSGAFGTKLANHKNFRPEIAIGLHSSKLDKFKDIPTDDVKLDGTISSFNVMVNAYYDIPINSQFIPFVTAGIGMSRNDLNITVSQVGAAQNKQKENWTSFAFQVGGGICFAVNEKMSIDLAAKYFKAGNKKFKNKTTFTPGAVINTTAGIRYTF